jgi:hypothetical protein
MTSQHPDNPSHRLPPQQRKPLFELGQVVATPAVLAHLEASRMLPAALLGYHRGGHWGEVDAHDKKVNDEAVLNGSRILSCYVVENVKIWVITEAQDDAGKRSATTLLFPSEY